MIFKYLIAAILAINSSSLIGEDGWFPVEKVLKSSEDGDLDDPSIWPLFVKAVGGEKILVRFPADPAYRYEDGILKVTSESAGEVLSLVIQNVSSNEFQTRNSSYFQDGKWIHEQIVQTNEHLFLLQTVSDDQKSVHHEEFISSFFIEKNSQNF